MRPVQFSLFRDKDGIIKKYEAEGDRKSIQIDERLNTNAMIDSIIKNDWQLTYIFLQLSILDPGFTLSTIILNHQMAEKLSTEAPSLFYLIFADSAFAPFPVTYFDEVWWDSKIGSVTFFDTTCTIFQEKLDKEVNKKLKGLKTRKQKVIVEMMDICWIYSGGKSFNAIIPALSDIIQ